MIDVSDARQLLGQTLSDSDGGKIGKIGQIYLDEQRGLPEWVTVKTGLFGTNESFVPLAEATVVDEGLRVPYSKKQIQGAPNIDEGGELSESQEQELYTYYGVPYTTEGSTFADTSRLGGGTAQSTQTTQTGAGTSSFDSAESHASTGTGDTETARAADAGTTADDTYTREGGTHETGTRETGTRGTGDDAMTRSEEQLNVGTEQVQTGTARLRKWVETENVQVDVPVKKEKATLVTEPVTEANRGDATSGADITEAEHEVVLNEERPTVSKEAVPVERVRLDKEVVEDSETVSDDVRKERIDLDGDAERTQR
jgi:uncharacterized protein (TIGR02271 family)